MTASIYIFQPSLLFNEGVTTTYTKNVCTQWTIGLNPSPDLCLHFVDDMNYQFLVPYLLLTAAMFIPLSKFSSISPFSNRNITFLCFVSSGSSLAPSSNLKTRWELLVLKIVKTFTEVHSVLLNTLVALEWDRWADTDSCASLHMPKQAWLQMSERPTLPCMRVALQNHNVQTHTGMVCCTAFTDWSF